MNAFDQAVLSYLNQFAGRSAGFDTLIYLLAANNLVKGAAIISVFWGLWFARWGCDRVGYVRATILTAIVGAAGGVVLARTLAYLLPFRARPIHQPDFLFRMPANLYPELSYLPGWSSFPSDHAAYFMGLATGLLLISRRLGLVAYLAGALFVLVPRLYLGYHYPTDILAGSLLGMAGTGGVQLLRSKSGAIQGLFDWALSWVERRPGIFYSLLFLACFQAAEFFDSARSLLIPAIRLAKAWLRH